MRLRNMSDMVHPMHLHGHTFALADTGLRKDTVTIRPMRTVEIEFDADNPGQSLNVNADAAARDGDVVTASGTPDDRVFARTRDHSIRAEEVTYDLKSRIATASGDAELTAGELRTRGYYLGSNVSYNLKKLVEMGYMHHQRSRMDRRSVRVSLTEKGQEVASIVGGVY